ncbi:UNVERIFIED_CONTAM: hypothetical protein PYX00_001429 [Menopon gallinae]
MYLGGGQTARQPHSRGEEIEMERLSTIREHKILGKRKSPYHHDISDFEDETSTDDKSVRTSDDKKQNHSEIEKRRRDKMNTYITELASMVPMCHANPRKLDKLTVLRMAVQHLRSIRGAVNSYAEGHYKPNFLSDEELKHLILQAADGFLFVVGCDRGRILFVSESVSQILNYSQADLLGQSWFDILHPKDVAKVKEQLSSSDLSPRERLIDSKTMLPVKTDVPQGATRLCPGARRSFLCRMKCRGSVQVKEEADTTTGCHRPRKKQQSSDKKYSVIQCTGYLKSWAPAKIGLEETDGEGDSELCNLSCLVAVGRVQSQVTFDHCRPVRNTRHLQFVSRHAMDGTFLFVDQRATLMLGFLPQELVGTNMYEYFHQEDIRMLSEIHKLALQSLQVTKTQNYRFRTKDGNYARIQSEYRPFKNPWTKEIEYLIAKNFFMSDVTADKGAARAEGPTQSTRNYDLLSQSNGISSVHRIVGSHIGASLIGQQIAREVTMRRGECSSNGSTPSPSGLDVESNGPVPSGESPISTSIPDEEDRKSVSMQRLTDSNSGPNSLNSAIRNNVTLSASAIDAGVSPDSEMMEMMSGTVMSQSPQQVVSNDGNDEAAMAVIMSLLEADAGLGGPVDFSGLPWPLP